MTNLIDFIGTLANLTVVIGAPIAIINYIHTEKQNRLDRAYGTYDALDDKYIDFMRLCMEKPYLNIFDIEHEDPVKLTPAQKHEELVAFSILSAIFERAYIMYRERDVDEGGQWDGWFITIKDYCRRDNFVDYWYKNGFGWDQRFEELICSLIKENANANQDLQLSAE